MGSAWGPSTKEATVAAALAGLVGNPNCGIFTHGVLASVELGLSSGSALRSYGKAQGWDTTSARLALRPAAWKRCRHYFWGCPQRGSSGAS